MVIVSGASRDRARTKNSLKTWSQNAGKLGSCVHGQKMYDTIKNGHGTPGCQTYPLDDLT